MNIFGWAPPGVSFLANILYRLLLPLAILKILFFIAEVYQIVPPYYATITCYILINPVLLVTQRAWLDMRNKQNAEKLGAVLPPRWRGRMFASLDLARELQQAFEHGYIGK